MEHLFHLIEPAVWAATEGEYRPPSLSVEGFIHFSFAGQVQDTANNHYGDAGELSVLEIDPALAGSEIRVEDSYGSGTAFPHLYGPLPVTAVIAVHGLSRDAHGRFSFASSGRA